MRKVSVCIPSYNAEKFIGETIRSVLDSTYQNFEIIVNDDASTDNTREVVESFHDDRIFFYQNDEKIGPVRNWNLAIKRANGEYAGLLNHDDLYGPFWLTFAVHQFEKHPHIGWVATAFRIIDEKGERLYTISRFDKNSEIGRSEAFLEIAKLNGLGPGFIARRKAFEEIAYYDEEAGPSADSDLFLRLAASYPLYYSGRCAQSAWRSHRYNLTYQWKPVEQTREGIRILKNIFDSPTLPQELRSYREPCLLYYYRKAKANAETFLQMNDQETYHQIMHILRQAGFNQ